MSDLIDINIDYETYSELDIKQVGTWAYALHPSTEIISLAWSIGDGPVELWLPGTAPLPAPFLNPTAYGWNAYNVFFEFLITYYVLGILIPVSNLSCTRAMGLSLALPGNLADLCRVLRLPSDKQKDKRGKELINKLTKPRREAKTGKLIRNRDPDLLREFYEYNIQDVVAEREAKKAMLPLQPLERVYWEHDFLINLRGVPIDVDLVKSAKELYDKYKPELANELKALTGLDNPNSGPQFVKWLNEVGFEVAACNKQVLDSITPTASPEIVDIIEKRKALARSPLTKYNSVLTRLSSGSARVYGVYDFHKANTGRFSATGTNFQNLPRPKLKNDVINAAIDVFKSHQDPTLIKGLFGDIIEVLSSSIRGMVHASPGKILRVADFSSIEARFLAWLAGQEDKLEVFRTHGKVYEHAAAGVYNVPIESISKDDPKRQAGKILELACGYQGSVGAVLGMAAQQKINLEPIALASGFRDVEEFAKDIIKKWRKNNENIVNLWYASERAYKKAMTTPGVHLVNDKLAFERWRDFLFMWLPSGRRLAFRDPHFTKGKYGDQVSCYRVDSNTGRWVLHNLYGGDTIQSATQGGARDLQIAAMLRCEQYGYPIVFHTHDEIGAETDENWGSHKELERLMCILPDWAKGLPIAAEGYSARRYRK